MKNNLLILLKVWLLLFFVYLIFRIFIYFFGEQRLYMLILCPILFNGYYVIKNGIKRSDITLYKIKNDQVKNNGFVAFVWLVFCTFVLVFWVVVKWNRSNDFCTSMEFGNIYIVFWAIAIIQRGYNDQKIQGSTSLQIFIGQTVVFVM